MIRFLCQRRLLPARNCCYKVLTQPSSLSAIWRARAARSRTLRGPRPRMLRLAGSHPLRRRLSSIVWLSTSICKPDLPGKRLKPPLLRNMRFMLRFSRWWLPFIAIHSNLESIHHWRAKKYMWFVHKWDQKSFPHCNCKWPSPIAMLHPLNALGHPP